MTDFVVETTGLVREFNGHRAVDGLNLRVPAGSIFGFVGKNGAGKTTTIRLLMGFLKPGGGEVRVFGETIDGPRSSHLNRRRIGFVSENKHLYPYMTVEQIIRFTRPFFPTWRDDLERRYLEMFNFAAEAKNFSSVERDAHQPDASSRHVAQRRTADSGRTDGGA